MKIGRNEQCKCGSGIKYKNCCIEKGDTTLDSIEISSEGLLSLIKLGLENIDAITPGGKSINVKKIVLMNGGDTILCEFHSSHLSSSDIKVEMSIIMGYFSGFFKDDLYKGFKIGYFAAKAFDSSDREIMYAISSKNAATAIGSGNSIEWLRSTYFQENTADYRMTRAKVFISDIENAIRKVIADVYITKIGSSWWDLKIPSTIGNPVKNIYENQFGLVITDGEILINYTFTEQLRKIISADWSSFKHLFDKKNDFEDAMVELNVIRREEAHNRDISEQHLLDLEKLYEQLLSKISMQYPNVVLVYLIENWRMKIKEIMTAPIKQTYTMREFDAIDDLSEKLQLIIKGCNRQITYIDNMTSKLKSLNPPLSKKQKHEELICLLDEYKNLQVTKLKTTSNIELDKIPEILETIKLHEQKMDIFSQDFLLTES